MLGFGQNCYNRLYKNLCGYSANAFFLSKDYRIKRIADAQHLLMLLRFTHRANLLKSFKFSKEGCIYMKIEIHGNDQLLPDEAYDEMRRQKCDGYMRRGMASRDTYYYKDVYVGCARAVDYLCSLPDWDGRNVIVTGGSQGGALTIVTSVLNEKVTLCAPFYPALCDLTGFLHQRAGGWPKFFSGFYKDGQTDIPQQQAVETLRYFDVVNFARRLKVPTFMSWGYSDDTCSPTSVWAAWNEITAPKQRDVTPTSGHWRFASSQAKCLEWMKSHMK